ncbi:hypothetical protein [Paraburkholderia sp. BR10954]|uniref:hypothetical protein n=1 Tax=Paraburkholderia sp. BR10954 TaxID=3236995 RepID=UPI0034D1FBDA
MHHHASLRAMLPLLAFTGLFVLVYAGEPVKYGFLLIYMEEHLKLSPAVRGAVIGVQPFIELLIMPFSIGLGRRLGNVWLMCIAAALGVCLPTFALRCGRPQRACSPDRF